MKHLLKTIAKSMLGNKLNYHISATWHLRNNNVMILNLHRVDNIRDTLWPACPPKVFRDFLDETSKYFSFVSLSQIENQTPKPKLVLSFDDGYLDFQTIALPILDELNIDCNQNIIPGCVESGLPPLNVLLQDFAGLVPISDLRKIDWNIEFPEGINPRFILGKFATQLKNSSPTSQIAYSNFIIPQLRKYNMQIEGTVMNLKQLQQMPKTVQIGNHSMFHFNANQMSFDEWKLDLEESENWFINKLNIEEKVYAFPNGEFEEEHLNELESRNYKHILLVGNSSSKISSITKKRVNFSPQTATEARFDLIRPLMSM